MPDDPRLIALRRTLATRPAAACDRRPETIEAGVALVVRPREQLELLLIKRAEHEADPWSGHMALPGGRREPADEDLLATAFRETEEETGVQMRRYGKLLGRLDELRPSTPRLPPIVIAPCIVGVPAATVAVPAPREVEAALWVPIDALRDEDALDELVLELEGGRRAFPSVRYGEYVIWGLTLRVLEQFLEVADAAGL